MKDKVTIITSNKNVLTSFNFLQILKYKDLFIELFRKDIKMRYKQTVLGVLWAIVQPLLSTLVFTLFFGKLIKISSGDLPYPVFVFIGLMFWNFFANSITGASGSLIGNESLIKKVYFPRFIIPISSIATNLFDLLITGIFFVFLIMFYGVVPNFSILVFFLIGMIITSVTSIGAGLFLSAINVKYRDIKHILPFFIQMLIFVTPVIYPVGIFTQQNQWILALNPLTSAIDLVRYSIYQNSTLNYQNIIISITVSLTTLLIGSKYFSRTQKYFADLI